MLADDEILSCYYRCFNSPEGEVVLNDLKNCFYNKTSLDEDASPHKVLVQEGKRFVVIYILSQIEEYIQRQKEQKENRENM